MNGLTFGCSRQRRSFAFMSKYSGCGVSSTSQGKLSSLAMLWVKPSTLLGLDSSPVNLNPGADMGFKLSAYTMLRQRSASHERHVQVVLPGVCPGVKCAVSASSPTRRISLSETDLTRCTRGNPLC